MNKDVQLLAEVYLQHIAEGSELSIRRIDDTTIDINGETKDITNWLYELAGDGSIITIWTKRKRDKKVGGQIIAHAGDEMKMNCRLGPCNRDVSGVGSPLGSPEERYEKYQNITVCAQRSEFNEWKTRTIGVAGITKVKAGNNVYTFS